MLISHEFYIFLSVFITGSLFFVCGLMFLFMVVPDNPLLGNYRKARYMMAAAYFFLVCAGMVEYLLGGSESDVQLMRAITLVISVTQAQLFTLALLSMLEVRFPEWRYIIREVALVLLMIIGVFTVYFFCGEDCFRVTFWLFCVVYAFLLAHYTRLFIRGYRQFHLRMNNYFSDLEAGRMQWTLFSFFSALTVGVMALLSAVFMTVITALIFTLVYDIFYVWFAIRFINYAHRFHLIEHAMDENVAPTQNEELTANDTFETDSNDPVVFARLDQQIEKWTVKKGFIQKGITIDALAFEFSTNRCYLSSYFNTSKGRTFREWINEMRIEEAKNLMYQYPNMPLNEISERTGFTDNSHFTRHFRKLTGETPKNWKRKK